MSDFDYRDLVKNLSQEKLLAAAAYFQDKETLQAQDPLTKHNLNNKAQGKLRSFSKRYKVIKGGNKIGKTDEMGYILACMTKGKCKEHSIPFPHKPPLNIWYCGSRS